jgi:class 3 adenylate cyclase
MISGNTAIDIVLTDINMPEMDGLTLLVNLNIVNPIIKAVIISAYGDMANIRTAMNNGAFDFITKPIDFDDLEITIQKTVKYVEQLKKTIQSIQENNILKMYVDPNVINFMVNQELEKDLLLSEKIEATVMFVDIVGFTTISEKQPADEVVSMLNDCFDAMVKLITIEDGYVDKFIGDAIMAVFKNDDHAIKAVKCACKIRNKMRDNGKFKVSIGINTGKMVSGNVGSQSLKRFDYTVIGDAVNTASRLQNAADAWQIVISEDVVVRITSNFTIERLGEFSLKNKEKPVVLFNVLGVKKDI